MLLLMQSTKDIMSDTQHRTVNESNDKGHSSPCGSQLLVRFVNSATL